MHYAYLILTFLISLFVPRSRKIWVFGESDLYVLLPLFEHSCTYSDSIKKIYISSDKNRVIQLKGNGLNAYLSTKFLAYYFIARAKVHFICKTKLSDLHNHLSFNALKINIFHGTPIKAIGIECIKKRNNSRSKFIYNIRRRRLANRYSKYQFYAELLLTQMLYTQNVLG